MLLHQRLAPYRLLLASQSPRRRELMAGCGIPFSLAERYDCDESYPADLTADEVPAFLSRLKSEAYPAPLTPNDLLLTADTVVILGSEVLGKPADSDEAHRMLRALSGNRHRVITGVTLRNSERSHTFSVCSEVLFRTLSDEEITYYINTYRPFDKAGSYGIQEWIGYVGIERIEGSFYNVMGLPVQRLYVELEKFITSE